MIKFILISKNYNLYFQEIVKRQIDNNNYNRIDYTNIDKSLDINNFPNELIDDSCTNIIIYLKTLFIGFGKNFFSNFKFHDTLFFNENIIFKYPDFPNIIHEHNYQDLIKHNIISITRENYNNNNINDYLFYLNNYNQNFIILFNRIIDKIYPIIRNNTTNISKYKIDINIFIDKKSGFLYEFFENILSINFDNSSDINLTVYNGYSKNIYLKKKIFKIINSSINSNKCNYKFINYEILDNDIEIQTKNYRIISLTNFKNSSFDYYFTVDLSHIIQNNNIIKNLILCNKDIIVPLFNQEDSYFSNFWTDIDDNGYYKSSELYYDIIHNKIKSILNIPYFYNTCLISKNFFSNYHKIDIFFSNNKWSVGDIDMAFCNNLRNFYIPIYLDATNIYGKIIKYKNAEKFWHKKEIYNTFDLYLLEDSHYFWSQKFINKIVLDNINSIDKISINEPIKDMYDFMFFTPTFCKSIIKISDNSNLWSDGSNDDKRLAGGYENVPTRDIHLYQIDLDKQWNFILDKYISKFASFLYSNFKTNDTNIIFIVKYSMEGQKELVPHHDSSSYSVLFTLNNEFSGGGTYFLRQNYKSINNPIGTCSIHPGRLTHYHSGLPITSGKRYILVGFIN